MREKSHQRMGKDVFMRLNSIIFLSLFMFNAMAIAASEKPLAPGYSPLAFKVPTAGSYQLPIIQKAADGIVLNTQNKKQTLYDLMGDKVVLLSFIYSACSDVNGCPLATMVLHKIKRRLQKDPEIASKLRLLTLSFNPEYDTPTVMQRYAKGFRSDVVDWQFLTTDSEQTLQPILDAYQQNVQKVYDDKGVFTGTFSHLLRVYLIDKNKKIRNIYSVSFLHADTLINDVKTLLLNEKREQKVAVIANSAIFQAGDNKQYYEQKDYQTQSISLVQRQGKPMDLLASFKHAPLGLPDVPVPEDNPISVAKIALGKQLFYDRRLSLNNTFSCAMCHIPEQGFSSHEMATAIGIEGRSVRRNSPTIYNVAYASVLFHDARENTLEQQVWGPLLAHNEMGNPSIGYVLDKIRSLPSYQGAFERVFSKSVNMLNLGQAIASYERSLNSANSAFDRWYFGQQATAVEPAVKRGFSLFQGKARCNQCHTLAKDFALFIDNKTHNTGIGYRDSMSPTLEKQEVQLAPGIFVNVDTQHLKSIRAAKISDLGRYEITQQPQDRWRYKTPTLRNIALTAPYMHNGSLATLAEVIHFYNQGGITNEGLDPLIQPLQLNKQEQADLLAFLRSLTGSNVEAIVSDAYTVPVGEF